MGQKNTITVKKNTEVNLSGITKFLCRVAGSDLTILSDPKCSQETSRHARIGAVIISTAVLATASMFFAIQTISQSIFTAVVVGVIWGFAIFFLDSYIIASYRKNDNKWIEFKIVLPRLILALILGCSISIPLELKFFSTEIHDEIISMKSERQTENQIKSNYQYETQINPLLDERKKLVNTNKELNEQLNAANKEI